MSEAYYIYIEGIGVNEITDFCDNGFNGYNIKLDDGTEWVMYQTREDAGEAAEEYWRDLAENDEREFMCLVGEENLIKWAMGKWAGPGSTQVRSLDEWFELWNDLPEEQWATYDGEEYDARISKSLQEELGMTNNVVVYRTY